MEIEISRKKAVLINEKLHPQVRHQKSNLWMQFEILIIKISNGFQFFRTNKEES